MNIELVGQFITNRRVPPELKHLSKGRKIKQTASTLVSIVIPVVAASELGKG